MPPFCRHRLVLVALAGALLLPRLGALDLWDPDEPRYAQISEEVRSYAHGPAGLVLLHLDGDPYAQKPPLYFWLAAALGAPGGRVSELAARLPSALAGIATVALVGGFGMRLLGARTGVWGALLLLTVFDFARLARRVQLDVLLTLLETSALYAFWRQARGEGPASRNLALLHASLGLAVLTKGPVGFLVPVLVMLVALGAEGRLREARRFFPAWGLALSLGPGIAWILAAIALAPAGFAGEAVGENLFGRFFAGTSHARHLTYFLYQFPASFLPWSLLWPLVGWVGAHRIAALPPESPRRRAWVFLGGWVLATLVFFSLSSGKRGLYLVPAFPAAALLCADALVEALDRGPWRRALASGATLLAGALAVLGTALVLAFPLRGALAERIPDWLAVGPLSLFGALLLAAVAGGFTAWRLAATAGGALRLAAVVGVAAACELGLFTLVFPALDPVRSLRSVATAAAGLVPPGEAIGLVGSRSKVGVLAYYGHRPVAELDGPEAIAAYLAGGGSALVVQERQLERVTAHTPVDRVLAHPGHRRLLVVAPAPDAATTSVTAPPPPREASSR